MVSILQVPADSNQSELIFVIEEQSYEREKGGVENEEDEKEISEE